MTTLKLHWSYSFIFFLVFTFHSFGQQSHNIELVGHFDYNRGANDVWGYVDENQNEYALVGLDSGISIVNITVPQNPVEEIRIYGPRTTWRDLKTWDHYAYVTHDLIGFNNTLEEQGLVIIDLDSLDNPVYKEIRLTVDFDTIIDTLKTAHNLYIDENGICYIFGANVGGGGCLMYDLKKDPWNPEFLGFFKKHYLHDGMVRGDTLWGAAIYYGHFLAIDVSDKANPVIIGEGATPNLFTHNCWISDDGKTLFTTDERADSYVASYDVSNLPQTRELDRIQRIPDSSAIPHNTHVYGDYLVTSYYSTGVQIVNAKYPDIMVDVGHFDTYPKNDGANYKGNWGAYPWLPSQHILVSDRDSGLFILKPDYKDAAYAEFQVSDYLTGEALFSSDLVFSLDSDSAIADLKGLYKKGWEGSGWDTVEVSKTGYQTRKIPFYYEEGEYKIVYLRLLKNGQNPNFINDQISMYPNPINAGGELSLIWPDASIGEKTTIEIISLTGQVISSKEYEVYADLSIQAPLKSGMYMVRISDNTMIYDIIKVLVI